MPELYVIAGPNGAGKSSLSSTILPEGLTSFDGDKELQILQQKFPETNDAQLFTHVNDELFPRRKEEAIKFGHDFAFEANFSSEKVIDSVAQFRLAGYTTTLIYIGLPSVNQANARVDIRVQQGGHAVSREDIFSNYYSGIEQTGKHLSSFDRVLIMENAAKAKIGLPRNLAQFRKGKLVSAAKKIPEWAEKIISQKKELLSKKRKGRDKGKKL
jgi:predicted ABC-type ATPase